MREIAHGEYEYRMQGGEIHRRPLDRDGLPPWQAAWLVLDKEKREKEVPALVLNNLQSAGQSMRFD